MTSPLIILDRDGVINHDSDNYIKSEYEWIAIESSLVAINRLTAAGFIIAVATNQSGITRRLFTLDTLDKIHTKMLTTVSRAGGSIDCIEYCPDHPDSAGPDRKPATGMVSKILNRYSANAHDTWFVGDTIADMQCATNAGCKPALVLTGKGERTIKSVELDKTIPVFNDLNSFVDCIL